MTDQITPFLPGAHLETAEARARAFEAARAMIAKLKLDPVRFEDEAKRAEEEMRALAAVRFERSIIKNHSDFEVTICVAQGKTIYHDVPDGWQDRTGVFIVGLDVPSGGTRSGSLPDNIRCFADFVECSLEYKDGDRYFTHDFREKEDPDGSGFRRTTFTFRNP